VILADQLAKLRFLFEQLAVAGTRDMVRRYIHPIERHRSAPEGLTALVEASGRIGARPFVA